MLFIFYYCSLCCSAKTQTLPFLFTSIIISYFVYCIIVIASPPQADEAISNFASQRLPRLLSVRARNDILVICIFSSFVFRIFRHEHQASGIEHPTHFRHFRHFNFTLLSYLQLARVSYLRFPHSSARFLYFPLQRGRRFECGVL